MSLHYVGSTYQVQPGDLLVRRKHSGFGWHYGTGVRYGLVAETTPDTGKRVTTLENFCAGEPGFIVRYDRTPFENAAVEQRALFNVGEPYTIPAANCEHDSNFAQIGLAISPTVDGVMCILGIVAVIGIAHSRSNN